jgi:hypothetical protein
MNDNVTWVPLIRLDLATASRDAFLDALKRLSGYNEELPPFPFDKDGWYDITPQMAEAALLSSAGNRMATLSVVRSYAADMAEGDWKATGEAISSVNGKLANGHHRLLACYLGGVSFRAYVVTSVEDTPNIFAYFDSGKKRSAADALYTAGVDGSGPAMARAIKDLALRYEAGQLGALKQPRFHPVTPRDVLAFTSRHPEFAEAAHHMLGSHTSAVGVIGSKSVAIFFAWLVLRAYDQATLADFCEKLGTGARLEEDSPILALRNRLAVPEAAGMKMPERERAAFLCKAFLMHVKEHTMIRYRNRVQPLALDTTEEFPRIEPLLAA